MSRFSRFLACICVAVIAPSTGASRADEPAGERDVAALVDALTHPDPDARAEAAAQLRRIGVRARPALVEAARSEDLTLAATAGELLVTLPWHRSDDPQAVRTALKGYGNPDVAARIEVVGRVASDYPRAIANRVLARLLVEEPNEDVCWHVVAALRRTMNEEARRGLREVEPAGRNRASALVMCARAWLDAEPSKAHALLHRAIEIESRAPTYDDGELDLAFDVLAAAEEAAGRYDAAADLRRQQSSRVGVQRAAYASPVFELFALHARFGPLRGFAADVETYTVYLAEPQVLYALARTYARCDDALSAAVLECAASAVSLRPSRRLRVAEFLRQSGWNDLAERELRAVVAQEPAAEVVVDHVNARLHLATIATERKDDRATAGHLRAVLALVETNRLELERTDDTGRRLPFDASQLRAQIAWHDFRAARDAGDAATADKHLAELIVLKPTTSRVVLDVVPHLKSVGREREAQAIFAHAYGIARNRLDAAPDDANAMNELAWLCARAGERLDEALELATRATAIAPANASYLDTAAEANFQVGRVDEAIRLEKAAVDLEPGNAFMREQLERFQAARER